MMVHLLCLVHFLTILAGLAHLNSNVQKFQRCAPIFIFIWTALTNLNPNLKNFRRFAPSSLFILAVFLCFPLIFEQLKYYTLKYRKIINKITVVTIFMGASSSRRPNFFPQRTHFIPHLQKKNFALKRHW